MKPRLKFLQVDAMGMFFGWYARLWWDKETRNRAIEEATETLEYFRKNRAGAINYFTWARPHDNDDESEYLFPMCPYPRAKGTHRPFILSEIRPKYIACIESFERIIKITHNRSLMCQDMSGYCFWPFENNVEKVPHYFSEKALEYHVNFTDILMHVNESVWGKVPYGFRIGNEYRHRGDHYRAHQIADYHRDLYDLSDLSKYVKPNDLYFDITLSEFVRAHFVEKGICPKFDPQDPVSYCDGWLGSDKYLTDNGRRQINIVSHGYTMWENAIVDLPVFLGSGWNPPSVYWYGGDGGAGAWKPWAKGFALYDPKGRMMLRQGNATQTRQLVFNSQGQAKERGKHLGYQITFFETLQGYDPSDPRNWPLMENYVKEVISNGPNRHRLNAARKGTLDVWGR